MKKKEVRKKEGAGERARKLGYFKEEEIERVGEIKRIKSEGMRMDKIEERIGKKKGKTTGTTTGAANRRTCAKRGCMSPGSTGIVAASAK